MLDKDYLDHPAFKITALVLAIGIVLIAGGAFYINKKYHNPQIETIKETEKEIKSLWPPPDLNTPQQAETRPDFNWGSVLRQLSNEHAVYWSVRFPRIIANLPDNIWIHGVSYIGKNAINFEPVAGNWKVQLPNNGFTIEGRIHSTNSNTKINKISKFILDNLKDPELTTHQNDWEIVNLERIDKSTITFTAFVNI
jgi:hypothetical protein